MARLISIGILARNGGTGFRHVLEAVAGQRCAHPTEVVVLDSGSTDGSVEAAEAAGAVVHEIPPESFSFGKSRDHLASLCRGEVLVMLSQDARPLSDDWLEQLTAPILAGEADVVQGLERLRDKPFYWDRTGKFYATSEWRAFFRQYGELGLSTVNLALSRTAWMRTGFGPIPMCSDKLFQQRVSKAGLRVELCPDAIVEHGHDYTTLKLFKRCANEGMGLRYLGIRVGASGALRDAVSPRLYRHLIRGARNREIRGWAEILFPVLRPLGIWYGNHFIDGYWR